MPNRQNPSAEIEVIGIDTGKSKFHLIGQDERGAVIMRAKVSRRQLDIRVASIPPCVIGTES